MLFRNWISTCGLVLSVVVVGFSVLGCQVRVGSEAKEASGAGAKFAGASFCISASLAWCSGLLARLVHSCGSLAMW